MECTKSEPQLVRESEAKPQLISDRYSKFILILRQTNRNPNDNTKLNTFSSNFMFFFVSNFIRFLITSLPNNCLHSFLLS